MEGLQTAMLAVAHLLLLVLLLLLLLLLAPISVYFCE